MHKRFMHGTATLRFAIVDIVNILAVKSFSVYSSGRTMLRDLKFLVPSATISA